MKVIVTGSAGFIGYHLSERLINEGFIVLGLDNYSDYYDVNLKKERTTLLLKNSQFSFKKVDLKDTEKFNSVVKEFSPETIFHLAAQAGVRYSVDNPISALNENVISSTNVLEACKLYNVKNFIFASSSSVYGFNKSPPFKESDSIDSPLSVYGASKRSCELIAHVYHKMYGVNVKILRFFTVYGQWSRPDMAIFKFSKKIINNQKIEVYNNGEHLRDFTFVSDIVEGIFAASEYKHGFDIFNLGSDSPVSLMDLITKLEERIGVKSEKLFLPLQKGDVFLTHANINKAREKLNYKPGVKIDQGLDFFMDWFLEKYR